MWRHTAAAMGLRLLLNFIIHYYLHVLVCQFHCVLNYKTLCCIAHREQLFVALISIQNFKKWSNFNLILSFSGVQINFICFISTLSDVYDKYLCQRHLCQVVMVVKLMCM